MSRDDPALQPFRVQLVDFTATLAELRAVRDDVIFYKYKVFSFVKQVKSTFVKC